MAEFVERRSGWPEYQKMVLSELKYLREGQDTTNAKLDLIVSKDIGDMRVQLATLKSQCAAYGTIAGLLVAAVLRFWGR
jgi:hypothetical protein